MVQAYHKHRRQHESEDCVDCLGGLLRCHRCACAPYKYDGASCLCILTVAGARLCLLERLALHRLILMYLQGALGGLHSLFSAVYARESLFGLRHGSLTITRGRGPYGNAECCGSSKTCAIAPVCLQVLSPRIARMHRLQQDSPASQCPTFYSSSPQTWCIPACHLDAAQIQRRNGTLVSMLLPLTNLTT